MNKLSLKFLVCVVLMLTAVVNVNSQAKNSDETAVEQSVARGAEANTTVTLFFTDGSVIRLVYAGSLYKYYPDGLQVFEYHLVSPSSELFSEKFRHGEVKNEGSKDAMEVFRDMFLGLPDIEDVRLVYKQ